jgi:hypothetical protein
MGARARLQLGQEVPHVALHRLLREEEAMADLAVDEAFRDQLENFDLTCGRLLLELPERSGERDHLGVALTALGGHLVEATGVAYVPGQDFFALGGVHAGPIGAQRRLL